MGLPAPRNTWERGIPWDMAGTPLVDAEMDKSPNSLSLYLSHPAGLFLRRGVGTAAQRLLQGSPDPPPPCSSVPAVGSCRLPPSEHESPQLHQPAKLFMCSKWQRAVSGGKPVLGSLWEQMCCPAGSCWEVGFQNHLLWLKIQELACQPLSSNYSRLICTFPGCILIQV